MSFRCTPLGTKVVIYHRVCNFMMNSMENVFILGTCAEIVYTMICKVGV